MLDVPFAMADATTLTEAGYVGEDVENIVQKLLQASDYDVQKAEKASFILMRLIKFLAKAKIHQSRVMFQVRACSKHRLSSLRGRWQIFHPRWPQAPTPRDDSGRYQ